MEFFRQTVINSPHLTIQIERKIKSTLHVGFFFLDHCKIQIDIKCRQFTFPNNKNLLITAKRTRNNYHNIGLHFGNF